MTTLFVGFFLFFLFNGGISFKQYRAETATGLNKYSEKLSLLGGMIVGLVLLILLFR